MNDFSARPFLAPVKTAWLLGGGLALLVAGFVWGALYAGAPYQDPTPEMAARYAFHLGVSEKAMGLGVLLVVAGIVLFVARRAMRRARPR